MVHIFSEIVRCCLVDLIGMHHSRYHILRTKLPLYKTEGFFVETLCIFIAAAPLEVHGIHINDDLIEECGTLPQSPHGDLSVFFHPAKNIHIGLFTGTFEVDIHGDAFRNDIDVVVGKILPFVMSFRCADIG